MALPVINGIKSVKVLSAGHPVFLVTTDQNESVIVKADAHKDIYRAGTMMEYHSKLFSGLKSRPFEVEIIKPAERDLVVNVPANKLKDKGNYWAMGKGTLTQENMFLVYKCTFIQGMVELDSIEQKLDRKYVLQNALRRKSKTVFKLGEIFALDAFVGNGDRYDLDLSTGNTFGEIHNFGNIFFVTVPGSSDIDVAGLDTWDPSGDTGMWKDLNKPVSQLEVGGKVWPGRILAPGQRRNRDLASQHAVDSIFKYINDANGLADVLVVSGANRRRLVSEFHKGMSSGKDYIRRKFKQHGTIGLSGDIAGGIGSRMRIVAGT